MLTITLTSIPPRYTHLRPTLESLLAQTVAAQVVLSLPKQHRRFPGAHPLPDIPSGVMLLQPERDHGPATKLLAPLAAGITGDILYCDDDCLYAPDWAETLCAARQPNTATAASAFPVQRLKRAASPPLDQIAQGFGGVLVTASMFSNAVFDLPPPAFAADDIWLSGLLAHRGIPITCAPNARTKLTPQTAPAPLQTAQIDGQSRAQANTACANALTKRFGIWPPLKPAKTP